MKIRKSTINKICKGMGIKDHNIAFSVLYRPKYEIDIHQMDFEYFTFCKNSGEAIIKAMNNGINVSDINRIIEHPSLTPELFNDFYHKTTLVDSNGIYLNKYKS